MAEIKQQTSEGNRETPSVRGEAVKEIWETGVRSPETGNGKLELREQLETINANRYIVPF
jgi:hypothetical protein